MYKQTFYFVNGESETFTHDKDPSKETFQALKEGKNHFQKGGTIVLLENVLKIEINNEEE